MVEANASWKKTRTTGQWTRVMAKHGPSLHKEWLAMVAASTKRGKLPEKLKHLIWTAVDAVPTHLYAAGAALHAEVAMEHGATVPEVMDTLRLACLPTMRGLHAGYPLLAAALSKAGKLQPKADRPQPAASQGWAEIAERLSPDFKRAYDTFIAGQMPGGLDARSRCLITLAVFSNPATADKEGTEKAIQQALDLGIDAEEILEAMEIASLIASHAFSITMDNLADALAAHSAK